MVKKVLLIAPLRVCYSVWPEEMVKWKDFKDITVNILHGPGKDEALKRDADIYIINPEGLEWLLDVQKTKTKSGKTRVSIDLRRWKKFGFDTLIVDELSKFKHTNTVRFKSLKLVLGTFARRWGLTGSPASNGLMDLFGQCYILDQGRSLGAFITHYRSMYFDKTKDGFGYILRHGADEQIYKRLDPLALRMAAEDYIDMPTVIENNIRVNLPDDVMEFYLSLEEDLIAKINDSTVVANNAAAASIKCRQVASGGIYIDQEVEALVKLPKSSREWMNLHTEKIDALSELIDELQGTPLLVAYDFGHDLDRLRHRFGKDIPFIGGGVPAKRSRELERAWNAGDIPVLFGHPQSMAHGLNLQEVGHHVAWHTPTWDYELYDQFIRRVRRQGNKHKKIFVHHILARGTIDIAVLSALKSKRRGQSALFDALKKMSKNRK